MVKSDAKNKDNKYSTNVIFDLYHPVTKEKLNMSYCNDIDIQLDIQTELENSTIDLYESLIESDIIYSTQRTHFITILVLRTPQPKVRT